MRRLSWTRCGRSAYWKDDSMKAKKRRPQKLGLALLVLLCILMLLMLSWGGSSAGPGKSPGEVSPEPVSATETPQPEETVEPSLPFPYPLEGGKLEVSSLFQFSGFNPDCGLAEGDNIASLSFTNCSGEYLSHAVFTVTLRDGTQLHFEAVDVPAGAGVMAFSTDNAVYDLSVPCDDITCEAEFAADAPLMADAVSVSVEGTAVTLTNLTGESLTNLVVNCHTLFEGSYFGGLTYSYPVETLEAWGSITLQAEDCFLGEAAVVRIAQNP